jgi:Zn-dependent protease
MISLIEGLKWLLSATLPAGRVFGIPLRVHLLMVIILPFMAWSFMGPGAFTLLGLSFAVSAIVLLYVSVLAHELGHAWGNHLVGGSTDAILLWPLGGIAFGRGGATSPRAELIVVALGPAVSILFAVIGHVALLLMPAITRESTLTYFFLYVCVRWFTSVNTMLALFNLLFPLFPMDSARLLRAFLSLRSDPRIVTENVCRLGIVLAVVLCMAGLFNFELPFLGRVSSFLFLIGIFGFQSCLMEQERIKYMPVYDKSDSWGGRTVYYDNDLMEQVRRRAGVGGLFSRRTRGSSPRTASRGPARIVDISPAIDVESMTDLDALHNLQIEAVNREDYKLAARVKKRLNDLLQ